MALEEKEIEELKKNMPKESLILNLADFFSVLGDSTRMQIISVLRMREMNVGDIAATLNLSISAVSHQLKILRQNDFVRTKRDGKYVYYYLSDEHVTSIFDMGEEHLMEDSEL